jgi:hypothetical protein
MGDRPTKLELLEAVGRFLSDELMPGLEGVHRFHTRVAANAIAIVAREIELEGSHLQDRHARLAGLLESSEPPPSDLARLSDAVEALERELCTRIRSGDADAGAWRGQVLEHLWATVRERLAVSNPTYR